MPLNSWSGTRFFPKKSTAKNSWKLHFHYDAFGEGCSLLAEGRGGGLLGFGE